MRYLKYIRTSILNKKLFTGLTITQIIFTIILVIEILVSISTINYKQRELEDNLSIDINKVYQFIVYGDDTGISELKNELNKYVNIGSYRYENCQFNELLNNEEFKTMKNLKYREIDGWNSTIPILKVDENIFNLLDVNITEGRNLKKDDFNKENEIDPIIFSNVYKGIVNIGDKLTFEGLEKQLYEVIGFYDENIKWIPENGVEFFGLEDLGEMAITIHSKADKIFTFFEKAIGNSTYITSDKLNKNDLENIVNEINQKYKLNVEVISIKEILQRFKEENSALIYQNLFFCIFMIISSCIGLSMNMLFTISSRKREFGIRIANGFRKKDIKLLVISEMIFLTTISTIVAMIIKLSEVYKNKEVSIAEKVLVPQFTINDFIIAIIIVGCIVVISSIIPLRKIDKLQPKEMIGGSE